MLNRNMNGIVMGALLGTMLGSAAFLFPKRQMLVNKMRAKSKEIAEKTKELGDSFYEELKHFGNSPKKSVASEDIVKGTLLGFLLGAGSALLLTPRSGKQLRKDLTETYQEMAHRTRGVMRFINRHPTLKKKILSITAKGKSISKPRAKKAAKSKTISRKRAAHK